MTLPQIQMTGNCVADAELRFTNSGKAIAKVRLACNSRIKRNNQWEDGETCFLDVVAWEQLGEGLAEVGLKGVKLVVTGRLAQRTYTTQSGDNRTVYEVTAEEIGKSAFAPRRQQQASGPGDDPWAAAPAQGWAAGGNNQQTRDEEPPPF